MAITALPTPPSRQDPTTFNDRADAFLGALPQFQTEANALQTDVNAKQAAASSSASVAATNASNAATSATNAAASATAANSTANVSIWVSGTTYAVGDNRFSPVNFLTYRRKTAGAGTTDPSLDATNWQLITNSTDFGAIGTYCVVFNASNTSIIMGQTIAGSSLRYNINYTNYNSQPFSGVVQPYAGYVALVNQNPNTTFPAGGSALSGTWRKMSGGESFISSYNSNENLYYLYWLPGLYVRIA